MAPGLGWDVSDPDAFTKPFNITPKYHRNLYPFISPENPQNAQQEKIIVIIGGGDGIGAAAAKVWARAGAEGIVLVARRAETLQAVAREIENDTGGSNKAVRVVVAPADVTDGEAVRGVFNKVRDTFGRAADVMLNVAGYSAEDERIGDTGVDEWWRTWVSTYLEDPTLSGARCDPRLTGPHSRCAPHLSLITKLPEDRPSTSEARTPQSITSFSRKRTPRRRPAPSSSSRATGPG